MGCSYLKKTFTAECMKFERSVESTITCSSVSAQPISMWWTSELQRRWRRKNMRSSGDGGNRFCSSAEQILSERIDSGCLSPGRSRCMTQSSLQPLTSFKNALTPDHGRPLVELVLDFSLSHKNTEGEWTQRTVVCCVCSFSCSIKIPCNIIYVALRKLLQSSQ